MNNSGSGTSAVVSRHDYLPFGEEIWAGVGLRTTAQKYATTDKVRQRFALTERDEATGLDHTWFRKYESFAGRWTTPDPYPGSIGNPQTLNRYSYVNNDPTNLTDPSGLLPNDCDGTLLTDADGITYCVNIDAGSVDVAIPPDITTFLFVTNSVFAGFIGIGGGFGGLGGALGVTEQQQERNDCLEFVAAVNQLANDSLTTTGFVTSLYNQFRGDREGNVNRSRGFRGEYTDEVGPGNSPNQVRHTAGGILAGYTGGVAAIPGRSATYPFALSLTLDRVNERERSYRQ